MKTIDGEDHKAIVIDHGREKRGGSQKKARNWVFFFFNETRYDRYDNFITSAWNMH